MKYVSIPVTFLLLANFFVASCSSNPYAPTNRVYKKKVKAYTRSLRAFPLVNATEDAVVQGDHWVGTTNFNMRKPNFVIIHHTAQHSTGQTLETFTQPRTQVSAHYVIGRDGKIYHMLNDYLRAWHGGVGKWGNDTDLNSSSIGIELDNNGNEPFSEAQINSLLTVLARLKKDYSIPTANFIGHADIAPSRKVDPNASFPWKKLADNGFGLWYDEEVLQDTSLALNTADSTISLENLVISDSTLVSGLVIPDSMIAPVPLPDPIRPQEALRIIGYDTQDMGAAIRAFKLHFIQSDTTSTLTAHDKKVLFNLYKKYL